MCEVSTICTAYCALERQKSTYRIHALLPLPGPRPPGVLSIHVQVWVGFDRAQYSASAKSTKAGRLHVESHNSQHHESRSENQVLGVVSEINTSLKIRLHMIALFRGKVQEELFAAGRVEQLNSGGIGMNCLDLIRSLIPTPSANLTSLRKTRARRISLRAVRLCCTLCQDGIYDFTRMVSLSMRKYASLLGVGKDDREHFARETDGEGCVGSLCQSEAEELIYKSSTPREYRLLAGPVQ